MMSPESLQAINDEVAAKAAKHKKVPYVPFDNTEPERWPPFPFPSLGSYVPPGWERTEDTFFVDSSGFGRSSDPALTIYQFQQLIREFVTDHPTYGYAIIDEGPFQLVVGAMKRVREEIQETLKSQ